MSQPSVSPRSTPPNAPSREPVGSPLSPSYGVASRRPSIAGSAGGRPPSATTMGPIGLGIGEVFSADAPTLTEAPRASGHHAASPQFAPRGHLSAHRAQPSYDSSHATPVHQPADRVQSPDGPRSGSVDPQRSRRLRASASPSPVPPALDSWRSHAWPQSPAQPVVDARSPRNVDTLGHAPIGDRPAPGTLPQAHSDNIAADNAAPPVRAFDALQHGARAVLLGVGVGFAIMAGTAAGTAHLLLPLGVPTILTGVLLGAVYIGLQLQSTPSLKQQATHMAVGGALLSLQAAAFATTPAPALLTAAACSVAVGLLPTLLVALPSHTALEARLRVAQAAEDVRCAVSVYSWVPAVVATALACLGRSEALMPALTALSLTGLVLDLHGRSWKTAEGLQYKIENLPAAAQLNGPPPPRRPLYRDAADALATLNLSMGVVSWFAVQAGGTPWRRWLRRSLGGANILPTSLWPATTRVAHEAPPIARQIPTQIWSRA